MLMFSVAEFEKAVVLNEACDLEGVFYLFKYIHCTKSLGGVLANAHVPRLASFKIHP